MVWVFILSAGCQKKEEFPIYQMEENQEEWEFLFIDEIQYERDRGGHWEEQAYYFHDNDQYVWTPAQGIGKQIGICGESGKLAIYEIVGDENHTFLYTTPLTFYFGGIEGHLWKKEGVSIEPPITEIISHITIVSTEDDSVLFQVEEPEIIAIMLDTYNNANKQIEGPFSIKEGWSSNFLILHHKDYPFLHYKIEYRYHQEKNTAVLYRKDSNEWIALPEEWTNFLVEYGSVDVS